MHAADPAHGHPAITPCGDGRWLAWRREQLARIGCDDGLAVMIAASRDVDLHAMLDLIARGCPPRLAARRAGLPTDPQGEAGR